jgi:hypothetical protein
MPWPASSPIASSPTWPCPSPAPSAGRDELSASYPCYAQKVFDPGEDRNQLEGISSVDSQKCRSQMPAGHVRPRSATKIETVKALRTLTIVQGFSLRYFSLILLSSEGIRSELLAGDPKYRLACQLAPRLLCDAKTLLSSSFARAWGDHLQALEMRTIRPSHRSLARCLHRSLRHSRPRRGGLRTYEKAIRVPKAIFSTLGARKFALDCSVGELSGGAGSYGTAFSADRYHQARAREFR